MEAQDETTPSSTVEERSAKEYADAMNAVLDIAELAVEFIPGAGAASKVAKVAPKALHLARKAADAMPKVAPVVGPFVKKAAGHAPEAASQGIDAAANAVGGLVKGVSDAAGGAVRAAGAVVRDAFDAKAQEEARRAARKAILDGAGVRMPLSTFLENWKLNASAVSGSEIDYLNYCGCYVLAVYGAAVKNDDFSMYRNIYVGESTDLGKRIYAEACGKGNVDIYADVKYRQHVYLMLYPCTEDRLEELKESLITALDADKSYNKTVAIHP